MIYSIGPPRHIMVRMSWFHQHVDNLCLSGWIPLWPTMSKKKNFNIFYSFHIGSEWPEYSTTSWLATEDINNSRTIMVDTYLCKHDNRVIYHTTSNVPISFCHVFTPINHVEFLNGLFDVVDICTHTIKRFLHKCWTVRNRALINNHELNRTKKKKKPTCIDSLRIQLKQFASVQFFSVLFGFCIFKQS
jgi:hypothetical protein